MYDKILEALTTITKREQFLNQKTEKFPKVIKEMSRDMKNQFSDCVVSGGKGCSSTDHQLGLFESKRIKSEVPMRKNQYDHQKQAYIFRRKRKRTETLSPQLCHQFMIRRNYAKTFQGLKTRTLSKSTSSTIVQYINKFVFDGNRNNLKISII